MSKVGIYQVMEHGDKVHRSGNEHVMMVIKLQLGKEEREKQKPSVIKTKVSNRFLF